MAAYKTLLLALPLVALCVDSTGGTLKLTWSDCGDSSTHAKVTGLTPDTLTLGQLTTVSGTGTLDEAVTGGTFEIDVKAGGGIVHQKFLGDTCQDKTFKLPLGVGSVKWYAMACPLAKGSTGVKMDITLSGSIPPSLARAAIQATAKTSAGDKLLCMTVTTAPEMLVSADVGRMPISVLEPLLIGAAAGFISDSPDVMACGMAVMGEVSDLKTAMEDLKKGIKGLNMTEIEAALNEVKAAVDAAPSAKTACKVVGADVKAIIGAIKQVPHQPKDLVILILSNFFDDGDKIFGELALSEKAYKTGRDYMTAGQNLGMSLRRMLVGELNGTKPLPPLPHSALEPLAIGMASGFISDSPDVMACGMAVMGEVTDLKTSMEDLTKGIKGLNMTEIEAALNEVKAAVHGSKAAKTTCKVVGADVKAIVQALKQIHGPKDLVIHIVDNFFGDGEPIFGGLAAAERAYKTGWDFMTAGQELGKVFRRMLVGEINAASKTAAPHSADIIV
jgi:hypothetical protein